MVIILKNVFNALLVVIFATRIFLIVRIAQMVTISIIRIIILFAKNVNQIVVNVVILVFAQNVNLATLLKIISANRLAKAYANYVIKTILLVYNAILAIN